MAYDIVTADLGHRSSLVGLHPKGRCLWSAWVSHAAVVSRLFHPSLTRIDLKGCEALLRCKPTDEEKLATVQRLAERLQDYEPEEVQTMLGRVGFERDGLRDARSLFPMPQVVRPSLGSRLGGAALGGAVALLLAGGAGAGLVLGAPEVLATLGYEAALYLSAACGSGGALLGALCPPQSSRQKGSTK